MESLVELLILADSLPFSSTNQIARKIMNSNTSWKQSLTKSALEKVTCLEKKLEMLQVECQQKQMQIESFEALYGQNHQIEITKLQQQIVNYDLMNRNTEKRLKNSLMHNNSLKSNLAFIEQELNSMKNEIEKIECDISHKGDQFHQEILVSNLKDVINHLQAETFEQVDGDQDIQSASDVFNSKACYQNSMLNQKLETQQEILKQVNFCSNCIEYESNVTTLKEQLVKCESKFKEMKKYFTVQFYQLENSQSKLLNIFKDKEKEINEWKIKFESADSSINLLKDENKSLEERSALLDDFLSAIKVELLKSTESLVSDENISEFVKDKSKRGFGNLKKDKANSSLADTEEKSCDFVISQISTLVLKNNTNKFIINEKNDTVVKSKEIVDELKKKLADVEREKVCIHQELNVLEKDDNLFQNSDSYKTLIEKLNSENKCLTVVIKDLKSQMKHKKTKTKKILRKLLDYKHCLSSITSLLFALFDHVDVNDDEFGVMLNSVTLQTKSIANFWQQDISIIETELAKHPEIFQDMQACFVKKLKEKQQIQATEKNILCNTAFENDTEKKLKSYEDQVTLMQFDYKRLLKNHLELQIKYEKLKEDLEKNGMIKFGEECFFKSCLKLK